jgi:hypothetical protein
MRSTAAPIVIPLHSASTVCFLREIRVHSRAVVRVRESRFQRGASGPFLIWALGRTQERAVGRRARQQRHCGILGRPVTSRCPCLVTAAPDTGRVTSPPPTESVCAPPSVRPLTHTPRNREAIEPRRSEIGPPPLSTDVLPIHRLGACTIFQPQKCAERKVSHVVGKTTGRVGTPRRFSPPPLPAVYGGVFSIFTVQLLAWKYIHHARRRRPLFHAAAVHAFLN